MLLRFLHANRLSFASACHALFVQTESGRAIQVSRGWRFYPMHEADGARFFPVIALQVVAPPAVANVDASPAASRRSIASPPRCFDGCASIDRRVATQHACVADEAKRRRTARPGRYGVPSVAYATRTRRAHAHVAPARASDDGAAVQSWNGTNCPASSSPSKRARAVTTDSATAAAPVDCSAPAGGTPHVAAQGLAAAPSSEASAALVPASTMRQPSSRAGPAPTSSRVKRAVGPLVHQTKAPET